MRLDLQAKHIMEKRAEEVVREVEATLRAEAPVYTGKLLASIRTEKVGEWHWVIAPHVKNKNGENYAYWAEEGSKPNGADGRIHAVNGKALKWVDPQGRVHYAESVRPHKGTHFVRKTVEKYR